MSSLFKEFGHYGTHVQCPHYSRSLATTVLMYSVLISQGVWLLFIYMYSVLIIQGVWPLIPLMYSVLIIQGVWPLIPLMYSVLIIQGVWPHVQCKYMYIHVYMHCASISYRYMYRCTSFIAACTAPQYRLSKRISGVRLCVR